MTSACTSMEERVLHLRPVLYSSIYIYICPQHAPEDLYITPMNPLSLKHWESSALPSAETDEMCSSPAASINPSKTDAASAAVGPPGNPLAEATVRQRTPARPQVGQEAFGRPACTKRHLVPVCSDRYSAQGLHGRIRTSGDAIVQDCLRPPARSERCLVTDGTPASAPGKVLCYSPSTLERPLIHRGRELSPESLFRRNTFSLKQIFLFFSRAEARSEFDPSSFFIFHPPKLPPLPQDMLVTLVAHLLVSPSFRHAPSRISPSVSWADLVRADPRKAHNCHFLGMSSRMGGRRRIEGAVPAMRFEEPDTTPESVSFEQAFVGEESKAVGRGLRRSGAWAIGGRSP